MAKHLLHLAVLLLCTCLAKSEAHDGATVTLSSANGADETTRSPQSKASSPSMLDDNLQERTSSVQTAEDTSQQTLTTTTSPLYEYHERTYSTDYTSSTVSTSTDNNDCRTVMHVLTDLDGNITWSGSLPYGCDATLSWWIQLPADYSVTLSIDDVEVVGELALELYAVNGDSLLSLLRRYYAHDEGFAPMLVHSNQTLVMVNQSDSGWGGSCTFNIRYYAHPLEDLPLRVMRPHEHSSSSRLYSCAHLPPHKLPRVFRCDKVQQCLEGEDEVDCDYKQEGCGDWIPYKDHCLKAEFLISMGMIPGHTHETMPMQAEEACESRYQAKLAILPDEEGVQLVTEMIRRSGFLNAVVGLKKLKPVSKKLRHLYRFLWQWGQQGSPVAYDRIQIQRDGPLLDCAVLDITLGSKFRPLACVLPQHIPQGYVCMRDNLNITSPTLVPSDFVANTSFPKPTSLPTRLQTKSCPDGSLVQTFHSCHWTGSQADRKDDENSVTKLPMFRCRYGEPVHYTLVCDGNDDCLDRSDELNCRPPRFQPLLEASFACRSSQVIPARFSCDGTPDCFDESDEENCVTCQDGSVMCAGVNCITVAYVHFFETCPTFPLHQEYFYPFILPSVVQFDGHGMTSTYPLPSCSEGLFQCRNGLCIPTFLINNGEKDCLSGEDENIPMEAITCPGYYRCQGYGYCVHGRYICDGIYHCPNKDDERYCDLPCPANCTCEGYAVTCSQMFDPHLHLAVRYLDLSGTFNPSLDGLHVMEFLRFLNLSICSLSRVELKDMPQLTILDLSFNALLGLSSLVFEKLSGLTHLNLSGNPFVKHLDSTFSDSLHEAGLSSLIDLRMRQTDLESIEGRAFAQLSSLSGLDLQDNKIEQFDEDVFWGLTDLKVLHTDTHKLCCPYYHQSFTLDACHAPVDELSSCSDLLRHDFFRAFLWTFSALAITGNAGVLMYRVFGQGQRSPSAFLVLVTNLCASDFLMGVYMMMIGSADEYFRGVYVSRETEWRESVVCKVAGFLAFVSSEVSAFVVCLVTLDRLLVLCFPLKVHLHMKVRSALVACASVWGVGLVIAAVPLIAQWDFYGQSGICLPLPITRRAFHGQAYAFGVFIVLNFVLFLFIGAGQLLVLQAIRKAGNQAGTQRRQQETAIARRLSLIVLTDFLCWFPIGLMGLLASSGTPIPGVVNVWAAIFVLPLNSALNPFIYTLNGLMQRWEKQKLEKQTKRALGRLRAEIPKWSNDSIEELVRICLRTKAVKKERVLRWLGVKEAVEEGSVDLNESPAHKTQLGQLEMMTSLETSTNLREDTLTTEMEDSTFD